MIAYDRLLRETDAVSYYATFDNFLVGQQQAWSVLNGLGLTDLEGIAAADARPVRSTSSSSRVRLTTTTRSSSSTAPWTCSSR